jgi:hypothetical protein
MDFKYLDCLIDESQPAIHLILCFEILSNFFQAGLKEIQIL